LHRFDTDHECDGQTDRQTDRQMNGQTHQQWLRRSRAKKRLLQVIQEIHTSLIKT